MLTLLLLLAPDSLDEVKARLASGEAVLVDVREQGEWDAGHLAQARLLPLSAIREDAAKAARSLPAKQIVYVHCKAGIRSAQAAKLLKPSGLDVRAIRESYDDLVKAGFPAAK
jgi:phage shock protein E